MSSHDTRVVYHATHSTDASILVSWLEQEGINGRVVEEEAADVFGAGLVAAPQVLVDASDYERAMQVVEQFKAELSKPTDMSVMSDEEGHFDWPICPSCDELRYAICQNCDFVGFEFLVENGVATCSKCKQPTEIVHVDVCKFCGHDFSQAHLQESMTGGGEEFNSSRVLVLVGMMILLVVVLAVWFVLATG